MTADLSRIRAVTFDCFGTLIDWDAGLRAAIRDLLGDAARDASDEDLLRMYADLERRAEQPPYKPYKDVLREVARGLCERFGVAATEDNARTLFESIRHWPAFDDTAEALRRLKDMGLLVGVLSNIDRDLFEEPAKKLGVELDLLITAEDVRSYKPAPAHFEKMLDAMHERSVEKPRILHAAQSIHHDIRPARRLGLPTCHVARGTSESQATPGSSGPADGAAAETRAKPDHTVQTVAELADLLEQAKA